MAQYTCQPLFHSPSSTPVKMEESEGDDIYYTCNGRLVYDLSDIPDGAVVHKHHRLRGGKGGFGSMLRAIGSQIEKTTNHEMCRDLSGRRMRDVNTERKLREWYAKASDREREKLERYHARRQRRQELLAKGPLPDHKFSDGKYERQKRKISYELHNALDVAVASILNEKRASASVSTSSSSSEPSKSKRSRLWIEKIDGDFSSSSSFSSGSSSDEDSNTLTQPTDQLTEKSDPERLDVSQSLASLREAHPEASVGPPESDKVGPSCAKVAAEPSSGETLPKPPEKPLTDEQLQTATDAHALEQFGMDALKKTLIAKGIKCGGTLSERAARLFSIRDLAPEDYPAKLRAKPKSSKS